MNRSRSILSRAWRNGGVHVALAVCVYLALICHTRFGIFDWRKEIAYLSHTHDSLREHGVLPGMWWARPAHLDDYPAIRQSANFLANPETLIFSPLTPLLPLIGVAAFAKLFIGVHFLIGLLGLGSLARALSWSGVQRRTACSLFLLSPIVLQHIAIGYLPWVNLFWFPALLSLFLHRRHVTSVVGAGMVFALILLQGGTHVFVWFAAFFLCVGMLTSLIERRPMAVLRVALSLGLAFGMSYVRIASTADAFSRFEQSLQPGYSFAGFLLWALVPPVTYGALEHTFVFGSQGGVPAWDGAVFWGLSLPLALVLLIRVRAVTIACAARAPNLCPLAFALASGFFLLISFGSVFAGMLKAVNVICDIPFAQGIEKYPFRWAIVSYLGLAFLLSHYARQLRAECLNAMRPSAWVRRYARGLERAFVVTVMLGALAGSALILWRWSAVMQMAGPLVLGFLLLALLTFVCYVRSRTQNAPRVWWDYAITVPLLMGSIMWLKPAIAVPYADLELLSVPAHPIAEPYQNDVMVNAWGPTQIQLKHVQGAPGNKVVLHQVPARDRRFLVSDPAPLEWEASSERIAFTLPAEGEVTLAMKPDLYTAPLRVTWISWIAGFILLSISYWPKRKAPRV